MDPGGVQELRVRGGVQEKGEPCGDGGGVQEPRRSPAVLAVCRSFAAAAVRRS